MDRLNWKLDIHKESSIPQINWDALKAYAISIKRTQDQCTGIARSVKCNIPPIYSMGGLHLVRVLALEDGTKWVARIELHEQTSESRTLFLSEKHTLCLIREKTDIPVPRVFGYDSSPDRIGRAFMIMEFIPGSTAMDAFGGPDFHGGKIPLQHKAKFHRDIAYIQVHANNRSYQGCI